MPRADGTAQHLESSETAAYLDGRLSAAERERVERHVADCAECRAELVEVGRVLKSLPRRRSWLIWGTAGAAAAAAAVLVLVVARSDHPPGSPSLTERGADEGATAIAIVRPGAGATVSPSEVEFVWHRAGADVQYRLTLTTERGDVVWTSAALPDTTRVMPAGVRLRGGREYFWYVDALLPDGRSATSGVRSLKVAP